MRQALGIRVVEREGVQRQVVRGQPQRLAQGRLPALQRLARHVIEKIEIDRLESRGPRLRHGRDHVARRVAPPEAPQLRAIHALGTERDAVDAETPERGQVAPLVRTRVGFEGDLRLGCEPEPRTDDRDKPPEPLPGDEGRRAAPKVQAPERRPIAHSQHAERGVQQFGAQFELPTHGLVQAIGPSAGTTGIGPGVDHEVAVGAARNAERQVDVQGDGRLRLAHPQRLSERSAFGSNTTGDGGTSGAAIIGHGAP